MTPTPDVNRETLAALSATLRSSNSLILVGAGASAACNYPTWTGFLQRLEPALHARLLPAYLEQLRHRDIRTRLDEIAGILGDDYAAAFRSTFSPPPEPAASPEWIRLLFDLPARYVLTNNYTDELLWAAASHPSEPLGPQPAGVSWYDSGGLDRALRREDGRLSLLYLHGRWSDDPSLQKDPDGRYYSHVILGEKSYAYAYQFPGQLARSLDALLATHTFLIVGASLHDEDVTAIFRRAKAASGARRAVHYAILAAHPGEDIGAIATDCVTRYGIQPIFFPSSPTTSSTPYDALEPLLRELVDQVGVSRPTRSIVVPHRPLLPRGVPSSPLIVHPLLRAPDYQPRPVYGQVLDDFLSRDAGGVLLLVGIGGAGKTAMVRHALDSLLGAPGSPRFAKVFVWSYYDNSSVSQCLRSLTEYVADEPVSAKSTQLALYERLRRTLRPELPVLIIFDGLERLQVDRPDDGHVHGQLESTVLRRFLLWLAQAPVAARALITTRFPLVDLDSERDSPRARMLAVDFLTRTEARSLLRRTGTTGTDLVLDEVLDHFGAHALTLAHLGTVIATYLGGDARRYRELASPLTRYAVGTAALSLSRVVAAYNRYLSHQEPPVQDTLRRIALFARPVGVRHIAQVFLQPGRELAAGTLAGCTQADLATYCHRLVDLRLIHAQLHDGERFFTIHPALRDFLLGGAWDEKAVLSALRGELEGNMIATLRGRPPGHIGDSGTIELAEELIGLSLRDGAVPRALDLYWSRLGGAGNLCYRLGDYARNEHLCRMICSADLKPGSRARIALDWGIALRFLGRLDEALDAFQIAARGGGRGRAEGHSSRVLTHMARVEVQLGRLAAAEGTLVKSIEKAAEAVAPWAQRTALIHLAAVQQLKGNLELAISTYRQCQNMSDPRWPSGAAWARSALGLARAAMQGKRLGEARTILESLRDHDERTGRESFRRRMGPLLAAIHRVDRSYGMAQSELMASREWALSSGDQDVLLWCNLESSLLRIDEADYSRAADEATEGWRTARVCGYGLFRIQFSQILARLALIGGDVDRAQSLANESLSESSRDECGFLWGQLEAHSLLAEVAKVKRVAAEVLFHDRTRDRLAVPTYVSSEAMRGIRLQAPERNTPSLSNRPSFGLKSPPIRLRLASPKRRSGRSRPRRSRREALESAEEE